MANFEYQPNGEPFDDSGPPDNSGELSAANEPDNQTWLSETEALGGANLDTSDVTAHRGRESDIDLPEPAADYIPETLPPRTTEIFVVARTSEQEGERHEFNPHSFDELPAHNEGTTPRELLEEGVDELIDRFPDLEHASGSLSRKVILERPSANGRTLLMVGVRPDGVRRVQVEAFCGPEAERETHLYTTRRGDLVRLGRDPVQFSKDIPSEGEISDEGMREAIRARDRQHETLVEMEVDAGWVHKPPSDEVAYLLDFAKGAKPMTVGLAELTNIANRRILSPTGPDLESAMNAAPDLTDVVTRFMQRHRGQTHPDALGSIEIPVSNPTNTKFMQVEAGFRLNDHGEQVPFVSIQYQRNLTDSDLPHEMWTDRPPDAVKYTQNMEYTIDTGIFYMANRFAFLDANDRVVRGHQFEPIMSDQLEVTKLRYFLWEPTI